MPTYRDFHIHGDNIVECERTFELIVTALADRIDAIEGPSGTPVCPRFLVHLKGDGGPLTFSFYPGFSRWEQDLLLHIRQRGGILREAADAIITGVAHGLESPLISIEFCGALPAGNQAWQRSGRAYSFALAEIPYLYVAELGGYELDKNRKRKAPRMPNPAVPFSYLSFSFQQNLLVLPVFVTSAGADEASRKAHADEFADSDLLALLRAVILNENIAEASESLRKKVLALVAKRADAARGGKTLTSDQWKAAYHELESGKSVVDYLATQIKLAWSKTAYIDALTNSAKSLMALASKYAVGLTSTELPMCIVPSQNRATFAAEVSKLYGNLPAEFVKWLSENRHLSICWVMGFKPRGDDARPDRGLPPLTRMLVGPEEDLLTVVYGPAPAATWPMLSNDPAKLASRNGLWEAILAVSDGLLVDASTDTHTNHGFLRSHWEKAIESTEVQDIFVNPHPSRLGENDVDTVLHTLLARHAGPELFEGLCNPPGGDWSGISLQNPDRTMELRWLSLPRVSGKDMKRPDHVFQLFGISSKPIILSVESKETPASVEKEIGPRLSKYVATLIESPASIERSDSSGEWKHSTHLLDADDFIFASAAACIASTDAQIESVEEKANADLVFAFQFSAGGATCDITVATSGDVASEIAAYLSSINLDGTGLSLTIRQ